MFETAIGNRTEKFRLQQKVAETSRVNTDIGTLLVDILGSSGIRLLAVGSGSGGLLVELVVGVVDEILLSRHVG